MMSLAAILILLAGCGHNKERLGALPSAPPTPLMPRPVSYQPLPPCSPPSAALTQNAPVDMVVFYVGSGREFDDVVGPDGYVLRVVFLDSNYKSVAIRRGMLRIFLLAQPEEQFQASWNISAADMPAMWIPSRLLDGYMLRLSWGATPPARGDFVFYVYYYPEGPDAPPAYCRRVFCQDYLLRPAELPADETAAAPQ